MFNTIDSLEVYFAGFHCDADTVIEEKITADTSPRRLTGRQQRPAAPQGRRRETGHPPSRRRSSGARCVAN